MHQALCVQYVLVVCCGKGWVPNARRPEVVHGHIEVRVRERDVQAGKCRHGSTWSWDGRVRRRNNTDPLNRTETVAGADDVVARGAVQGEGVVNEEVHFLGEVEPCAIEALVHPAAVAKRVVHKEDVVVEYLVEIWLQQ